MAITVRTKACGGKVHELLISRGYLACFPQLPLRSTQLQLITASIVFIFMEQLFPNPVEDVDPADLYASDQRQSGTDRPWVLANMISSLDGAIDVDGVSGPLGGQADKRVFSAIRAVADAIVVGAGTVIAENYRRPQTPTDVQSLRQARGQSSLPRIAIVSSSLSIPVDHRVFDADAPPIVITHAQSPAERREVLAERAEVIVIGDDHVDLAEALQALAHSGAKTVLLEGGPTLNGAMVAADLVDEICMSVAPVLVGGTGARMMSGIHTHAVRGMRLDRVLHEDGYLFLRYLRDA